MLRLTTFAFFIVSAAAAETLYNGIVLPEVWPPYRDIETLRRGEVMAVPYLKTPPAVIPIDLGRQLFVDDFLISETTLRREFHRPQPWEGNPIMRPDKRWEMIYQTPKTAFAFSDGGPTNLCRNSLGFRGVFLKSLSKKGSHL